MRTVVLNELGDFKDDMIQRRQDLQELVDDDEAPLTLKCHRTTKVQT